MRIIILVLFVYIFGFNDMNAQTNVSGGNFTTSGQASNFFSSGKYGFTNFINPTRRIEGTEYLFDNWNSQAIVYTIDNQHFSIKNVNLNINRNSFCAKYAKDSIFTFNFNNIKKININGKEYKNVFTSAGKKIFQIIYESVGFSVVKGFNVELISGSPNPMVNRPTDKFVRRQSYYILRGNNLKNFKLKKKKVLNLMGADEALTTIVKQYAETNNLSFKNDIDVAKLFQYYSTLL